MQTLNVSLKVEGLLLHLRMQGLNPLTTCGRTELTHGAALFRMTAMIPGLLFIGRLCVVSTPSVTMPTRRAKKTIPAAALTHDTARRRLLLSSLCWRSERGS